MRTLFFTATLAATMNLAFQVNAIQLDASLEPLADAAIELSQVDSSLLTMAETAKPFLPANMGEVEKILNEGSADTGSHMLYRAVLMALDSFLDSAPKASDKLIDDWNAWKDLLDAVDKSWGYEKKAGIVNGPERENYQRLIRRLKKTL